MWFKFNDDGNEYKARFKTDRTSLYVYIKKKGLFGFYYSLTKVYISGTIYSSIYDNYCNMPDKEYETRVIKRARIELNNYNKAKAQQQIIKKRF